LDFVGVLLELVLVNVEEMDGLLSAFLVFVGAISSNRTLEYAEEFSHIDVLVAVLTFYSKM
jgi:hypothetical protein